jgi:hypothetical protein
MAAAAGDQSIRTTVRNKGWIEMDITPEQSTGEQNGWRSVGTVVGNAGTGEFTFILRQFQARVGDIVALSLDTPDDTYDSQARIYVWARITDFTDLIPSSLSKRLRRSPEKAFH